MRWKPFLKEYFSFSQRERYAMLGLCVLMLIVIAVKFSLPHLVRQKPPDTTAYEHEIALFRQGVDSLNALKTKKYEISPEREATHHITYFIFDPNTATDTDWESLGLNKRQINNIRNYQAKGGFFRKKEDLKKLYSMPEPQYKNLEPYIRIAAKTFEDSRTTSIFPVTPEKARKERVVAVIELNTADSIALTSLSGIGPILASRIIKYRKLTGGFSSVLQLDEVYGIKSELIQQLESQISADTSLIRKIPLNTATFKTLVSHPYINEQQTKGILKYRQLQGSIHNLHELIRNNILTQEEAERIKLYVSFEK